MPIHLDRRDLINIQQMEVAVNGPDGATHLVICTGVADLGSVGHETYTFLIGPQLSRRQFIGAIASGAISTIHTDDQNVTRDNDVEMGASLILIEADYDDESRQVRVSAQVSSRNAMTKLAISYNVSILAEMPIY
ncbi:MAG TPA: hypothetical protein VK206_02180 [Anaerolineales bacterium]|nr:hypothetical protein [Anaerolineales bacterium]